MNIRELLRQCPFIAIMRGIKKSEVVEAGRILLNAGFKVIEIPLNSPKPYESIRALAEAFGKDALIGAGTVLTPAEVEKVVNAGGKVIISPDCNPDVIHKAKECDCVSLPGVATPTEAFTALRARADGLKFFPAEIVTPSVLKALSAVLPRETLLIPVGGVTADNWGDFVTAGAVGFGLGSSLYKAGMPMEDLQIRAQKFIDSLGK